MKNITFNLNIILKDQQSNQALAQHTIEAWFHHADKADTLIGEAKTDDNGQCQITFEWEAAIKRSGKLQAIYFKIYQYGQLIYNSLKQQERYFLKSQKHEIILTVESQTHANEGDYTVKGQIVEGDGTPIRGVMVLPFHKDICDHVLIDRDRVNKQGFYQIDYNPVQEGEPINLVIKTLGAKTGEEIGVAPLLINAKKEEIVHIVQGGGKYIPSARIAVPQNSLEGVLKKCGDIYNLQQDDIRLISTQFQLSNKEVTNYIKGSSTAQILGFAPCKKLTTSRRYPPVKRSLFTYKTRQ